jgi:predicted KAP-like P-loop ATPase
MWADNEVNVDLLNVAHLTAAVLSLVDDDNLAPMTIGVYGDWGSGKSTVLRLVEAELRSKAKHESGVVCVWFNSWQFETYDDAKAAIMSAILEELRAQRGTLAKAKTSIAALARRVKWFRAAGLAAKGLGRLKLAIVTGGLSEAGLAVADSLKAGAADVEGKDLADLIEDDEQESGAGPHSVREFRNEFQKLGSRRCRTTTTSSTARRSGR